MTNPKASEDTLRPEEMPSMVRAVEKCTLEFTSGRVAARQAMLDMGHAPKAVLMAPDCSPIWSDCLVVSTTYSDDVCIAVVTQSSSGRSVGIDIEPGTPLDPDLEDVICPPSERAWLDAHCEERCGHLAKQVFCMKESFYKALYPLTGQVLRLEEVEVRLPFQNITGFILKSSDRAEVLPIETRLGAVAHSVSIYASLTEISCPFVHSTAPNYED
ncbi:4'-phosphopantetheinyl transferase family protein [Ruegeria sp. ANG-S4]|uniref:4'-phosphopantetheinyl transferase family protein n=1 Tax=Ruegeria sp. ANG-S4 TaxID=1577904 RepID=UPI00126A0CFD|nr:4'-phosphopantetheinyl transferase superfamily protein [Ruegeria sp. ANG-S4]